jgi:CBS domain-containing protein
MIGVEAQPSIPEVSRMAFTLEDLLPLGQQLTTAQPHDPVLKVIDTMSQHGYGQLPIIGKDGKFQGLVTTFESIVRAVQAFETLPDNLLVLDATQRVRSYQADADLLATLDDIHRDNFAVIVDDGRPRGIVTTADVAVFFREYAEDLMLIEDIESHVKDAIQALYANHAAGLDSAITAVTDRTADIRKRFPGAIKAYLGRAGIPFPDSEIDMQAQAEADKKLGLPEPVGKFESLAFNEYIEVLLRHERAPKLSQAKDVSELRGLLQKVRDARNKLAHFRGELTSEERRNIRFAADWLEQNLPTPLSEVPAQQGASIVSLAGNARHSLTSSDEMDEEVEEPLGTYAPLASHLRKAPSSALTVTLTFDQIEGILKKELPRSAFQYRAWWSNDPTKPQSAAWLDEGWRTNAVNMTERRLTFVRADDRERAYIRFFALLKGQLLIEGGIPLRNTSPQGSSWYTIVSLDRSDSVTLVASFARRKRLRLELYLDYGNRDQNKQRFDQLRARAADFEQTVREPLEWERLDDRRACRVAVYTHANILTDSERPTLLEWAAKRAGLMYRAFASEFSSSVAGGPE